MICSIVCCGHIVGYNKNAMPRVEDPTKTPWYKHWFLDVSIIVALIGLVMTVMAQSTENGREKQKIEDRVGNVETKVSDHDTRIKEVEKIPIILNRMDQKLTDMHDFLGVPPRKTK